ncbi:MAG: hypothetical protein AB1571_00985 [Nanoarchaeota archaeon]
MLEKLLNGIKRKGLPLLAAAFIGCGSNDIFYDKVIVNLSICYHEFGCQEKLNIDVYVDNTQYQDSSNIEFIDKFNNDKKEFKDHEIKVKYSKSYDPEFLSLKIYNISPRFKENIWLCNIGHAYVNVELCYNECSKNDGVLNSISDCLKEPDGG